MQREKDLSQEHAQLCAKRTMKWRKLQQKEVAKGQGTFQD
eukprot:CAMPEP_0178465342 /NCGR_PEP_ID=MMETSP0689_2-20121128/51312_1 /TAXON_ID=160604 /ORGANISM="Amphidinium massartii, Strain CS-259" /LENGTH=39 /DNA_ID= /DNA_START= /DNA_END= /DNA_ORIENTATION=